MAPAPFVLSTFAISSVGTALAVASANTLNQVIEVEHDAKMIRTRQRMLPAGIITTRHATIFAIATGLAGGALLYRYLLRSL
jgi:protoheme IX farnesyltransferase